MINKLNTVAGAAGITMLSCILILVGVFVPDHKGWIVAIILSASSFVFMAFSIFAWFYERGITDNSKERGE